MLLLLACTGTTAETPARMLTPTEFQNATRDLIGLPYEGLDPRYDDDEDGAATQLPVELGVHGFEGFVEGQVPSAYTVESVQRAAVEMAAYAPDSDAFVACDDLGECHQQSVARFANRAFRRPLTDDERSRLQTFHDSNVAALGGRDGTQMTVAGILQTPQFLYTPTFADGGPADSFALAARLALFLWDSIPDPELFQAAADGRLRNARQVRKQARRMLEDPRAQDMVVRFHHQWMEVEDVYTNHADLAAYSGAHGVDPDGWETVQDYEEAWSVALIGFHRGMELEVEHFVKDVVFGDNGTLGDLLTSDQGWVTTAEDDDGWGAYTTASVYGEVERRDGDERDYFFNDGNLTFNLTLVPVTWPSDQRAGLLTSGAVLSGKAHAIHPAPILRGTFIYERLMCQPVGQPPDGALDAAPPDTLSADGTNRQRLEAITAVDGCNGCHDTFNGLGFAFENYDSMGAWRTQDNSLPVDASGTVTLDGESVPFNNAVELAHALGSSEQVHDCYSLWWTRYALGRMETAGEDFGALQSAFRRTGNVQDLLVDIAASPAFMGGDA